MNFSSVVWRAFHKMKHLFVFLKHPPFFPHDTCSVPAGYERERKLNQVIMLTKTLRDGLYWNWGPVLALPHMGPYSSKAHGFRIYPIWCCAISAAKCQTLDIRDGKAVLPNDYSFTKRKRSQYKKKKWKHFAAIVKTASSFFQFPSE